MLEEYSFCFLSNSIERFCLYLCLGMHKVDFGDLEQLRQKLEQHGKNVAAFIVEPIQGEAGYAAPSSFLIDFCV